jgi:hypothetical protein
MASPRALPTMPPKYFALISVIRHPSSSGSFHKETVLRTLLNSIIGSPEILLEKMDKTCV